MVTPNDSNDSSASPLEPGSGTGLAELKKVLPMLQHPDGSPVRALVVDDEPMLADLVSMGLSMCGWTVKTAHAGRAAVEAARSFHPDVLVLDWMLPEIDGTEVLAKIRASMPEVSRAGEDIELTATQFELLRYLMENPKAVLSKSQILDHVWHYDFAGQANIVELYISYLRKKIDAGRSPMIHTLRGAGYVIRPA